MEHTHDQIKALRRQLHDMLRDFVVAYSAVDKVPVADRVRTLDDAIDKLRKLHELVKTHPLLPQLEIELSSNSARLWTKGIWGNQYIYPTGLDPSHPDFLAWPQAAGQHFFTDMLYTVSPTPLTELPAECFPKSVRDDLEQAKPNSSDN